MPEPDPVSKTEFCNSIALPMLPMLPGRHLNFAQSSHHLSRLRQANSPVATAMMIRPLQVESLQGSRQCNQAHAQGMSAWATICMKLSEIWHLRETVISCCVTWDSTMDESRSFQCSWFPVHTEDGALKLWSEHITLNRLIG